MRKIAFSTKFGYLLLLLFAIPFMLHAQNQTSKDGEFELNDNDRVVFLGNSLFESDKYGYLELALTTRWPDKKLLSVISVGKGITYLGRHAALLLTHQQPTRS